MDAMTALVDSARASGAFVLRSELSPPWSMRIDDHAPLCVIVTTRGSAHLTHGGSDIRLEPGDVALVRDSAGSYVLADDPTTPPQVAIDATQVPSVLRPDSIPMRMLGVRCWGNSTSPRTVMLSGTYQARGEVSETLLSLLPPVAVVRGADSGIDPLLTLLADEVARDELGQDGVIDRLLDLALVRAVRTWFSRTDTTRNWITASRDPLIGAALRLVHERCDHPWTVESLAKSVGLSRAAFARRFQELVGTPPLTYLTQWRLARAADLLRTTTRTLTDIASEVGYGSGFALSNAFRRDRGESPQHYRSRTVAQPPSDALGVVRIEQHR